MMNSFMKFSIIPLLLAACLVAGQEEALGPNGQPRPEPYSFAYSADSTGALSSREETGDANGRITGFYTIAGPDGRERRVDYVADADGYRATVKTNEIGTKPQDTGDALFQVSAPSDAQLAQANQPPRPQAPLSSGPSGEAVQRPDSSFRPIASAIPSPSTGQQQQEEPQSSAGNQAGSAAAAGNQQQQEQIPSANSRFESAAAAARTEDFQQQQQQTLLNVEDIQINEQPQLQQVQIQRQEPIGLINQGEIQANFRPLAPAQPIIIEQQPRRVIQQQQQLQQPFLFQQEIAQNPLPAPIFVTRQPQQQQQQKVAQRQEELIKVVEIPRPQIVQQVQRVEQQPQQVINIGEAKFGPMPPVQVTRQEEQVQVIEQPKAPAAPAPPAPQPQFEVIQLPEPQSQPQPQPQPQPIVQLIRDTPPAPLPVAQFQPTKSAGAAKGRQQVQQVFVAPQPQQQKQPQLVSLPQPVQIVEQPQLVAVAPEPEILVPQFAAERLRPVQQQQAPQLPVRVNIQPAAARQPALNLQTTFQQTPIKGSQVQIQQEDQQPAAAPAPVQAPKGVEIINLREEAQAEAPQAPAETPAPTPAPVATEAPAPVAPQPTQRPGGRLIFGKTRVGTKFGVKSAQAQLAAPQPVPILAAPAPIIVEEAPAPAPVLAPAPQNQFLAFGTRLGTKSKPS